MKKIIAFFSIITFFLLILFITECAPTGNSSNSSGKKDKSDSSHKNKLSAIIDHSCININSIPVSAINNAKNTLHIAYGHTSHGNQIIIGMNGLDNFKGGTGLYLWNDGSQAGYLDIDNNFVDGDLGNPDRETWALRTRDYLNNPVYSDVNVVIWSWCGQADGSEEDINTYLNLMNQLEIDYPDITFVYMTGHLNGSGLTDNLHLRNEQIREYCRNNKKWLFDFADIESYDPDGVYYGDRYATDACNYDFNNDGGTTQTGGDPALPINPDRNWALDWQSANPGEWYDCAPDHTHPLNGNLKAYAAWWLWARIAGWNP